MIKFARISKNGFLGRFGTVRPKSRRTGFFEKNPTGSTFFKYCPPTSGQKIRKIVRAVFQKFSIYHHFWAILGHFGPFWDCLAQIPENRIFREKSGWVKFLQILSPNFRPKIRKIVGAVFQKFSIYHHFWAILGHFGPFWDRLAQNPENRIFRAKSGSVSFHHLWSPNFMPKIKKILGAVFQNFCFRPSRASW